MSAVVGAFGGGNAEHLSVERIRLMAAPLAHRGASGGADYADRQVAMLGGTVAFDGVLSNRAEISKLLEGECASPASDAALIAALYRRRGRDCLRALHGAFALALYDPQARVLLLARDRAGQKPLYYTEHERTLFFASEIKAFWQIPRFSPPLSKAGVTSYFSYTQCPAPASIYEGVFKIPPAHWLAVSADGSQRLEPYWRLDFTTKIAPDLADASERLGAVLGDSVRSRASVDPPPAVALSGGIDSGVVLGLLTRSHGAPIRTFTLCGQAGADPDPELRRAQEVATFHGSDQRVLECGDASFESFEQAIAYYDEPIGIPDTVHYLRLVEAARPHATGLLTGTGTTLFTTGREDPLLPPEPLELGASSVAALMRRNAVAYVAQNRRRLFSDALSRWAADHDPDDHLRYYHALAEVTDPLDADSFLTLYVKLNHVLTLEDTMGMAFGLEVSSPYLDHRVLELAASLPSALKCDPQGRSTHDKPVLRALAHAHMPAGLLHVPKFICGHFIDYDGKWRSIWRERVEALLFGRHAKLGELVSREKAATLWRRFLDGAIDRYEHYTVRKLIIFAIWYEQVFEGRHAR